MAILNSGSVSDYPTNQELTQFANKLLPVICDSGANRPECPQLSYAYERLFERCRLVPAPDGLFVSQRDHGIDLGGATRGDVARDKRD